MTVTPTTSHWGAYGVRVGPDGTVDVVPHPADPAPSPLLGNVAGALRHPTRVRAPAVRRGWLEHGPGPTGRRGREEFVEVDWDTALTLVAGELTRVRDTHGNGAIYGGSYGWASAGRFHHAQSQLHRFLNCFGGYVSSRNSYSNGTSTVVLPHIVGGSEEVLRRASSWSTIAEHTELIVAFGGIPAKNVYVTPGGVTKHGTPGALATLAARGVRVVLVSPLRDDLPAAAGTGWTAGTAGTGPTDADWWPVVPGTDVALMLGLAHTLVAEGLHDQGFLDRYTEGADRFLASLTGHDADWAAGICGIGADRIRALARTMAANRTLITVTWSLQRIQHGEQPVWAGIALAALLGQIGLPGGGFGHGYGSMGDVGDNGPTARLPHLPQGTNPVRDYIPVARVADMLLHPGEAYDYDGERRTYPDIRLVHWAGGNPFHHHQDLRRLREAFGRPDTVIVHEPHWTATARHADIVLPTTTSLEREDLGGGRRDTHFIAMHRAVDPVGAARDDYTILGGLAAKLGFGERFTEGRTARQWLEHLHSGWSDEPFEEFWARGEVELPPGPARFTLFEEFRAGTPLPTPSGRIELYSATVASFGYPDCPGLPVWLEPDEWLGNAGAYPLHLIANQPSTRLHSQNDVGATSQRSKVAGREPIRLHPADAAARGVRDGDVVRVFNDRGACLAGAVLTDRIRPGVVQLPTGAWFDPLDQPDGTVLCVHGNPNVLTADIGSSRLSQGCTGQHALVELERFTGDLPPVTVTRPPTIVRTGSETMTTLSGVLAPAALDRLPEVSARLAAKAGEHDRDATFPFDGVDAVHEAGLLTATVATRYGGPGLGLAGTTTILRELGKGDPSVALVTAMTLFTHAGQARDASWPEAWYARLLDDSRTAATLVNALRVEPELGTPARGGLPATLARGTREGWQLDGHKIFSTGAVALTWMLVWARTDEDPTRVGSFLVRRGTPGVHIEPTWDHLGLRASRSDDVILTGVPVPRDAVVGLAEPKPGPGRAAELMAWNSIGLAAIYVGVAEAARDWLVGFLHERVPTGLGKPLATLPRFQSAVGEIEAAILGAGDLLTGLATRVDAGDPDAVAHAGIGKLLATRAAISAVEQAVALVGNNGLTRHNPLQRHHRDVLCARVHTPQDDTILTNAGQAALNRTAKK